MCQALRYPVFCCARASQLWAVRSRHQEAGLLACASFLNVTFVSRRFERLLPVVVVVVGQSAQSSDFRVNEVPLHFYGSVQLVRFLEGVAEDTWKQVGSAEIINDFHFKLDSLQADGMLQKSGGPLGTALERFRQRSCTPTGAQIDSFGLAFRY